MTNHNITYLRLLLLLTLTCVGTGSVYAKSASITNIGLEGAWVLDEEESKRIQPAPAKDSIFSRIRGSTNVSVGGIPVPKSSTAQSTETRGKANDPDVLFCKGMNIIATSESVRIDYDGLGAKTFYIGKVRGRKTAYSAKRLTTSYESTSRKVSQKYVMDGPNKVIVTVTLKPNSGKKRVIKKAFNRKAE